MKIVEVDLEQITPFVHFQSEQTGHAPRASEIKPRFDKYLETKKDCKNINLKYKLYVSYNGKVNTYKNLENNKKLFYLNRNDFFNYNTINLKFIFLYINNKPIKSNTNIDNILSYFCKFIIINNFGFRKNKGFGSFLVSKIKINNKINKDLYFEINNTIKTILEKEYENTNYNMVESKYTNNNIIDTMQKMEKYNKKLASNLDKYKLKQNPIKFKIFEDSIYIFIDKSFNKGEDKIEKEFKSIFGGSNNG